MSVKKFLLLCAATLPASMVLLRDGFFSSSDGMIHLYRVFELDRALHAGIFFSRWFPLSGYSYGLPVLNYYPPLAYYLAEIFHLLGAGYIVSIKLLIAFGFILSALSMYLFTRDVLGASAAFVGAIAFTYSPYLLSDAYIRGNFPEFLAMALIPLAMYAFRNLYVTRDPKFLILAAISFTAIVLTHHLTAMLAAPLVAGYVFFLFALDRDWKKLFACVGAALVALALSAFYWVPAITELGLVFVGPGSLPRFLVSRLVTVEQFFAPSLAYTYLPQSDALQHSAGFPQTIFALLACIPAVVSLRAAMWRSNFQLSISIFRLDENELASPQTERLLAMTRANALLFFLILVASIFMMLADSAPLWYAIPTLRFMQFPWRFQVLAGISIAFLIGVVAKQLRTSNYHFRIVSLSLLALSLIALAMVNLPDRSFALTDGEVNLLRSDDSNYVIAQMGWSWTREFVPATVREENVVGAITRRVSPETPRALPAVRIENEGLLSRSTRVSTLEPFELSLHQFFFPGWQAYVDGAPARTYASGSLGLVTVNAPAGDHTITVRFEETPFRTAMDMISSLAFVGVAAWLSRARRRAFIALVIAIIFLGSIFGLHTGAAPATQPIALSTDFGHSAMLIGYSTERAGDALFVTLYWFALREMDRDYVAYVHLVGAGGEITAQNDSLTDWGMTPTTRWQRGEMVRDRRTLKNVPHGTYRLVAGMYLPRENGFENLAAFDRAGNAVGNHVEMGEIQIGQ